MFPPKKNRLPAREPFTTNYLSQFRVRLSEVVFEIRAKRISMLGGRQLHYVVLRLLLSSGDSLFVLSDTSLTSRGLLSLPPRTATLTSTSSTSH